MNDVKLFSGYDYFLILRNKSLWGIGSNSCSQISSLPIERFNDPVFIADNVIWAAAGRFYSAYITEDLNVYILGKGIYADEPVLLPYAREIFISENNQFLIKDENGTLRGFGDNVQEGVCKRTTQNVHEERDIPLSSHYGCSVTRKFISQYNTYAMDPRNTSDVQAEYTKRILDDFRATPLYSRLFAENYMYNITAKVTFRELSYNEETLDASAVADLSVDIMNLFILNPVELSPEDGQRLLEVMMRENGISPEIREHGSFTKLAVTKRNTGLALREDGVMMTADLRHNSFSVPRIGFDRVSDIAVTRGEEFENNCLIAHDGDVFLGHLGSISPAGDTTTRSIRDSVTSALFAKGKENMLGGLLNNLSLRRLSFREGQ